MKITITNVIVYNVFIVKLFIISMFLERKLVRDISGTPVTEFPENYQLLVILMYIGAVLKNDKSILLFVPNYKRFKHLQNLI